MTTRRGTGTLLLSAALLAGCAAGSENEPDEGAEPGAAAPGDTAARKPPPRSPSKPPARAPRPPVVNEDPVAPPPPAPQDDRAGPCGGVDAAGACEGQVAVWCGGGRLRRLDCRDYGLVCAWDDALRRHACVEADGAPAGEDDFAPPPDEGAPPPPDDRAPPPPEDGAPPPPDDRAPPPPDEGAPPPPDDGAPPPPADDGPAPPDQGCGDLDYLGRCEGSVAVWCDAGQVRRVDCAEYGQPCGWVDDDTGFFCGGQGPGPDEPPVAPEPPDDEPPSAPEPPPAEDPAAPEPPPDGPAPPPPDDRAPPPPDEDPCGGLDYLGTCDGDVAVWCADGALQRVDCAARGQTCGWVDDQTGYFCGGQGPGPDDPGAGDPDPGAGDPDPGADDPAGGCGELDYLGACEGTVATWCDAGQVQRVECADFGQVCGWIDDATGYYCRAP